MRLKVGDGVLLLRFRTNSSEPLTTHGDTDIIYPGEDLDMVSK